LGIFEHGLCSDFVTKTNCLANFFDCGAQRRAEADVVSALFVSLTCALACLNGIGHVRIYQRNRRKAGL
jgi:hypothetical protein